MINLVGKYVITNSEAIGEIIGHYPNRIIEVDGAHDVEMVTVKTPDGMMYEFLINDDDVDTDYEIIDDKFKYELLAS
jgi:hypothetical protein